MSEHECVIGMLYDFDDTDLVTLNELLEEIDFQWCSYTLKDYADRRKSTNLTRFEFCPYCGKKIDWKKIKSEGE